MVWIDEGVRSCAEDEVTAEIAHCSKMDKVCEVYARALYICLGGEAMDRAGDYDEQILALMRIFEQSGLQNLSPSVSISRDDLREIKEALYAAQWHAVMRVWMDCMISAGRFTYIYGALKKCRGLIKCGREILCVESAQELTEQEKRAFEGFGRKVLGEYAYAKHVCVPGLFAGVRLRKGWKAIDLSLRAHMMQAKEGLNRC